MLNIGKLDPDEEIMGTETKDCMFVLNMMVKQWQGKSDFAPGLKLWTRKRGHLLLNHGGSKYTLRNTTLGWTNDLVQTTLYAGAATDDTTITVVATAGLAIGDVIAIELDTGFLWYTVITGLVHVLLAAETGEIISTEDPIDLEIDMYPTTGVIYVSLEDGLPSPASVGNIVYAYLVTAEFPLVVEAAFLRDDAFGDTPLRLLTMEDHAYLPNKEDITSQGDPAAIHYEAGLNQGLLWTDVGAAQDVSKHIVLVYQETVQDFTSISDEPYYPQEWFMALCWGLSEQIAPMFRSNWTQKQEGLKTTALAIARNKGAELSSLYFQPGAED